MNSENKVIRIASLWATVLAIIKFIFWIMSGSMVLIASAVDSLLDLMVSLFNLFALKESKKPADQDHNYGHGKIEGIAAIIEGLIITGSAFFIIFSSLKKLFWNPEISQITSSIFIMLFSLLVTGMIVFLLQSVSKTTKSLIVKSDLIHYKMDFLTNAGVILALVIVKFTDLVWIDPLIAIGIAIYILRWCGGIIKDGIDLLMDKSLGKDEEIWELILAHPAVSSFHKLKSHQSGGKVFISFHMVFKDENIRLKDAHIVSREIEMKLKKHFKRASVLIRLDPFDDH